MIENWKLIKLSISWLAIDPNRWIIFIKEEEEENKQQQQPLLLQVLEL